MFTEVVRTLDKYGVGIMQMPCPEVLHIGCQRWWHSRNLYDNAGFRHCCRKLAEQMVDYMENYAIVGYDVVAVLVCDGSPTCGLTVSSYYENGGGHPAEPVRSLRRQPGIYTEELLKAIEARGLPAPPMYGLLMDDREKTNEQIIAEFDAFIRTRAGGLTARRARGFEAEGGAVPGTPRAAAPFFTEGGVNAMRGMTFAQKALARAAGKEHVEIGEIVNANVDVAMMDDILGPRIEIAQGLEELGVGVWDKSKVVVISDHYTPPCEIKQAEAVKFTKDWSLAKDVDYHEYEGPCHQVLAEACYDQPGTLVVGTDSHTCMSGAFGAFGTGIGSTEMLGVVATWAKFG